MLCIVIHHHQPRDHVDQQPRDPESIDPGSNFDQNRSKPVGTAKTRNIYRAKQGLFHFCLQKWKSPYIPAANISGFPGFSQKNPKFPKKPKKREKRVQNDFRLFSVKSKSGRGPKPEKNHFWIAKKPNFFHSKSVEKSVLTVVPHKVQVTHYVVFEPNRLM